MRPLGASVLALRQMPQAVTIQRHHSGFGAGEKRGEENKGYQRTDEYAERKVTQKRLCLLTRYPSVAPICPDGPLARLVPCPPEDQF